MEHSQEVLDFLQKQGKIIYEKGLSAGKAGGKDQTANQKEFAKIGDSLAKLVSDNKVPDEKKIRGQLKNLLDGLTRDSLLRLGKDCLTLGMSMPKPESKPKETPPSTN